MSEPSPMPIAIIGASARLPGADTLDAFWDLLQRGGDAITDVPAGRWDPAAFYAADQAAAGKTYSTRGGFLDDIDAFDAPFFGIEPAEAARMDPQQRLALQEAWRTFEDAGYAPDRLRGRKVGVFVGARTGDYHDSILHRPEELEPQALMGHDTSVLSARISHCLDLHGPNLTVNTACSSMGVALHLAVQSLRAGEVELALVGGVHVMTTPQRFLMHSRSRLLSKTGQCRPFDEDADGFVLGEAVGFVLLKRRADALADRDGSYGSILATGVSHNGHVEKGIAAPNPAAQGALIREVLARAGVPAGSIGYVEAHGSGTYKGDAIEAGALAQAYAAAAGAETGGPRFAIGSVKANVGHALTAAVLPGLLKLLLCLRHRRLVAQPHFATANALLQSDAAPFQVQARTAEWGGDGPRRAALSALSYSGTNFHLIVEEEPARLRPGAAGGPWLVAVSARTDAALDEQVRRLAGWLERHQAGVALADVAFTLATGREHFECRAAFVAADLADCLAQLRGWRGRPESADSECDTSMADAQAKVEALLAEVGADTAGASPERLAELGRCYERGATMRWEALFPAEAQRIRVPGYAFERHRYALRPAAAEGTGEARRPDLTLFFCRRDDVYQAFVSAGPDQPASPAVIQVKPGNTGFRQLGPGIFQIDPGDPAHYGRLLAALGLLGGKRIQVVHLWNHECEPVDFARHGDIDRCVHLVDRGLEAGARSLVRLRRSLAAVAAGSSLSILYVSHGLQPQDGMASGWLADAGDTAPEIAFRGLRLRERIADPARLAAMLRRELDRGAGPGFSVVDADGEPGGPAAAAASSERLRVDPAGAYVIDAGDDEHALLAVAEWRRTGAGRLVVLVDPARVAPAQSRLGPGVAVLPQLAGGDDFGRLERALAAVGAATIRGVVRFVRANDRAHFRGNVVATLLLDEFTKDAPLDFFALLAADVPAGPRGAVRFADAFVALREDLSRRGRRHGVTLVRRWTGSGPADAAAAFHAVFAAGSQAPVQSTPAADAADLAARERGFRRIVADVLKLEAGEVDLAASLDRLRFDSMRVVDVIDRLQRAFGTELRPSVFYKHKDLRGVFDEWVAAAGPAAPSPRLDPPPPPVEPGERAPAATATTDATPEPIAIIGMSGRFPMAADLDEFWRNLCDGRDCIATMPRRGAAAPAAAPGQPIRGGFIDGIDIFDPQFFGISTREAELMDPQQRLFLQCAWQAIEDAGYDPTALAGSATGVFVGVATCDYASLLEHAGQEAQPHGPIGWFHSILANRLSYLLDLRGPSQPVDTACSSSLVAVHRAVQAIRGGQCAQALVGGVNALLTTPLFRAFADAGMLAPDGRCKTFDARADGYVRGEGVGVLVLKPLRRALADGDAIHAVIRASAEGHGGRASSLTAPSAPAQAEVITRAYREARIDPRTVGYIEAHGTGTALGDPIEVDGLKQAFAALGAGAPAGDAAAHCGIGSVKTNIGHLEAAAGVAGLIKVVLALRHGTLPATLHFVTRNRYIAFEGSPFFVVDRTQPWPAGADAAGRRLPRRGGVSSFGFGGVNAHVVLEEHIPAARRTAGPAGRGWPILLSAKTEDRLRARAAQLLAFLETAPAAADDGSSPATTLRNLAYTLQVGRTAMDERLALCVDSQEALVAALRAFLAGREAAGAYRGSAGHADQTLALFGSDDALRAAVGKWIADRNWSRVLELWVRGLPVDWRELYAGTVAPARVHLPAYPFTGERYWVQPAEPRAEVTAPAAGVGGPGANGPMGADGGRDHGDNGAGGRRSCVLRKAWEPCPTVPVARTVGPVLIIANADTELLARQVAQRLPAAEVVRLDGDEVTPPQPWPAYAGCIDLLGCATAASADIAGLVALQPLIEQAGERQPFLLGVTRGLETVGNASVNLAGAARAALFRMLPREYAAVRSRHLDVDPAAGDDAVAKHIAAEFACGGDEPQVCRRGEARYRAVLREATVPEAAISFPAGHVLWVTGGTRGLGALCAAHFVRRHGVRKVVLTGRVPWPARAEWEKFERQGGALAEKIRRVRELEGQGAEVRVFGVDVADRAAMQRCVADVRRELGPAGGVLHCAGVVDAETPAFIRKSAAGMAAVLAPKVRGTQVLLELFRDEPLSFLALFSSVSAAVPALAVGLGDYAMANAFLDHAAEAHAGKLPIVSLQWPSWRDTGMGEVRTKAYAQAGFLSHTDEEGLRALDRVLAAKAGPVLLPAVVGGGAPGAPGAPGSRFTVHGSRWQAGAAGDISGGTPAGAGAAPAERACAWLTDLFAQELKMSADRLAPDRPWHEYGMDSILLAQAWKRIERHVGARLDPSAVFEQPTLRALAGWLVRTQPQALGAVLAEAGARPGGAPVVVAPPPRAAVAARPSRAEPRLPDIAVVGASCRFSGANDLDAYWRLLAEGRTAIARVPDERWPNPDGFMAGLLDGVMDFDPEYFLLPEEDARAMDPQARLVLEETLRLFHHAGYKTAEVKGAATGVYLGARMTAPLEPAQLAGARNPILAAGQNYLAANVSRFFDLRGPSLVVDTACSSALVAMKLAVQALRAGELDAAIVGGVSVLASDAAHRLFRQRNLLSPGGVFHLFDGRAAGVVLGEGVGFVLLKTLERAERDGDRIYAVVRALAVNNDGRTAGPATPNLQAQRAVMESALAEAGLAAGDVQHLEVNGSGSEVTDLLELKAIEAVYGGPRPEPCSLGSIKPNIGHPLCAEGIAGFLKLVLMLHHGARPPFLSGEVPMAHGSLAAFALPRSREAWAGGPRRAALNCFADGGTNVHVIVEAGAGRTAARAPLAPPVLRRRRLGVAARNPWPAVFDGSLPFLRDHAAYGQRVLPGLAYIDFLYQHFRDKGCGAAELELRNLSIHHPLTLPPGQGIRLDVETEEREPGCWQVRVRGTDIAADDAAAGSTLLVTAEMRRVPAAALGAPIDLAAMRRAAAEPLAAAYAHFRTKGLVHTGAMLAEGAVHVTADARVIEVVLPAAARASAGDYLFHPTLIDGAAVGAGPLFAGLTAGEDRLFLPLFYGRFRASGPLGERCIARVRTASLRRKNELLYSDLEFFNERGEPVAELTDFAYKLVRHPGQLRPAEGGDRTFPAAAQSTIVTVVDAAAGAPADAGEGPAARLLRRVIGAKAKRDPAAVDLRCGYYEMGLDSSSLLDVVATLGRTMAVALSPTLLFEYATPAELAVHLEQAYPEQLAGAPEPAGAPADPGFEHRAFPLPDRADAAPAGSGEAERLVAEIVAARAALWVADGALHVRAAAGRLTPALVAQLEADAPRIARVVGDRRLVPLTRSQKRYWVLSALQPEKSAYNNPIGMRLRGPVDVARLRRAFVLLMNTHAVLRSRCRRLGREPVLEIAPPLAVAPCDVTRLAAPAGDAREQALLALAAAESRAPINPAVGPNVRIRVVVAADDDVTVLLTAHHSVFDGYSYLPVMSELMRLYRALAAGAEPATAGAPAYEDYALREPPAGEPASGAFWRGHLAGAPASVALPLDRPRPALNAGHGDTRSTWIAPEAYRGLTAAVQEQRVTLFAFMLSLLNAAVAGWSGQADLVFGTTVQCRDRDEDQQVIGDFTNFIPIRSRVEPAEPFPALLQQVYRTSLLCLQHKHFPFDELVAMAAPAPRHVNPVYNILVNQLPSITGMEERLSDPALRVSVGNNRLLNQSAMLDLRFEWYEENGGLRLICEYNTELFRDGTIESWLGRFAAGVAAQTYRGDVAAWMAAFAAPMPEAGDAAPASAPATVAGGPGDGELEPWLVGKIRDLKPIAGIEGMTDVNFFELGLGSFDVANLSAELEAEFPRFVVSDLFKHPTIRALAAFLRTQREPEPAPAATPTADAPAADAGIDFDLFRT